MRSTELEKIRMCCLIKLYTNFYYLKNKLYNQTPTSTGEKQPRAQGRMLRALLADRNTKALGLLIVASCTITLCACAGDAALAVLLNLLPGGMKVWGLGFSLGFKNYTFFCDSELLRDLNKAPTPLLLSDCFCAACASCSWLTHPRQRRARCSANPTRPANFD